MKKEINVSNTNTNRTITHQIENGQDGSYISEVQSFKEPEGYEDAFKKYYPTNKSDNDSAKTKAF